MILLIDNYDSFSYNLYQLVGALNPDIRVARNDSLTVDEIRGLEPEAVILSPGPGKPGEAGRVKKSFRGWAVKFPYWVYAWAIRQSARPSEQLSPMQRS